MNKHPESSMKFYESPNKVRFTKSTNNKERSMELPHGRRGLEYNPDGLKFGARNPITAPVNDPL